MWQHDLKGLLLRKLWLIQLLITHVTMSLGWAYSVLILFSFQAQSI